MRPDGVLLDFEEALSNAFLAVFEAILIWHDFSLPTSKCQESKENESLRPRKRGDQ